MSLLKDCQKYFNTKNLYDVLSTHKEATESEIKKAYRLVSLKVHPDHAEDEEKEEATRKFQTVSKVYFILSNADKRKYYDETGIVDEEADFEDKDWRAYWALIFPKITIDDINSFFEKYKGSKDEENDLIKSYLQFEGDMDKISENFIGYDVNEEERYAEIINKMIKKGDVPEFKKFTHQPKNAQKRRKNKYASEAKEAEQLRKEMNLDNEKSLKELINNNQRARQKSFSSLMASLEEKYSKPSASKKRKK